MRKEKSVENCASGVSDHLQGKGSVSRVGKVQASQVQGPLTSSQPALHLLTFVQINSSASRPHTHHRPRCRIAGRQQRGREAAQAKEERCSLHFAMQLHRPQSCHALALRPLALNCLHCKAAALHWQASNFVQCNAQQCLPMHSLPCTAIV